MVVTSTTKIHYINKMEKVKCRKWKKFVLSTILAQFRSIQQNISFFSIFFLILAFSWIPKTVLVFSFRAFCSEHYPYDGELLCSQVTSSILWCAASCCSCRSPRRSLVLLALDAPSFQENVNFLMNSVFCFLFCVCTLNQFAFSRIAACNATIW